MAATLRIGDQLREHWEALKRGRPGRRFQERYERTHCRGAGAPKTCGWGTRILMILGAVVCLAIAVVLSVIPGPAIPFFFIAGGLLATESRLVARGMDWAEVKFRALAAWGKRRWGRLPRAARLALVVLGCACSAGLAYGSYRLVSG